jgi:Spy/CpxP family protein refolding chaperone
MKRSITLATALALSSSIVGYSAEPNVAPSTPRTSNVRVMHGGGIFRSGIVGTNQTQAERDIEQHEKVVKLTDAQKQQIKSRLPRRCKSSKRR